LAGRIPLTKDQMLAKLLSLKQEGWVASLRPINDGGIGNTIDTRLGVEENNLPIADTAQWELKTHRKDSTALLSLFQLEPQPRDKFIVPRFLLPKYGWPHATIPQEMSFRQTINAVAPSDRGFGLTLDEPNERLDVYFDSSKVDTNRHGDWLKSVEIRVGLGPLNPQPYWNFKELFLKTSTKMLNAFYVEAETKKSAGVEMFAITDVFVLQQLDMDKFTRAIAAGGVLVDFDARTHHNHGVKIRIRQNIIPSLYRYIEKH